MIKDRYGLVLTTQSIAAAEKYCQAMDSALAGNAHSEKWFEQATQLDPQFAMAHIAHAENLFNKGKFEDSKIALNKAIALSKAVSERERAHIHIEALLLNNNPERALAEILDHVKSHPTDARLVSKAVGGFGLFAFSGTQDHNTTRLQFMESLIPYYGIDWWFLSMHSFALVEVFRLKEARNKIELSIHLNERNGHAAHSYSHIFYETGQTEECIKFTKHWLQNYEREAHLYTHIHWHWALSELANENYTQVQEIYNNHIRPGVSLSDPLGLIADASALVWRSRLKGIDILDVEQRAELNQYAQKIGTFNETIFGEAHLALIYMHPEFGEERESFLNKLRLRHTSNPCIKNELTLKLVEGVNAYTKGDYLTAIDILSSVRSFISVMGGSNAQRELFEDTLIQCHLKLGNLMEATTIIDQRMHRQRQV